MIYKYHGTLTVKYVNTQYNHRMTALEVLETFIRSNIIYCSFDLQVLLQPMVSRGALSSVIIVHAELFKDKKKIMPFKILKMFSHDI